MATSFFLLFFVLAVCGQLILPFSRVVWLGLHLFMFTFFSVHLLTVSYLFEMGSQGGGWFFPNFMSNSAQPSNDLKLSSSGINENGQESFDRSEVSMLVVFPNCKTAVSNGSLGN